MSSIGTCEGARTGVSFSLMSGELEVMALYLGSVTLKWKCLKCAKISLESSPRTRGPITTGASYGHRTTSHDHAVWVPAFAGTTLTATPPPQSTTPKCLFAHAGDFRPH